jgi:hypothetical protein
MINSVGLCRIKTLNYKPSNDKTAGHPAGAERKRAQQSDLLVLAGGEAALRSS